MKQRYPNPFARTQSWLSLGFDQEPRVLAGSYACCETREVNESVKPQLAFYDKFNWQEYIVQYFVKLAEPCMFSICILIN